MEIEIGRGKKARRACSAVSISQSCRRRNALFQFAYAARAQFPQVKVS